MDVGRGPFADDGRGRRCVCASWVASWERASDRKHAEDKENWTGLIGFRAWVSSPVLSMATALLVRDERGGRCVLE